MAFSRKSYSGPMKDRGEVMRGGKKLANVSKEELDDFRAKFGKDKTLRDLLNADRGSAPKAEAPKAEAPKPAPKPAPKAEAPKAEAPKSMTPAEKGKNLASKLRLPDSITKTKEYDKKGAANRYTAPPKKEEPESKIDVPEGKTGIDRMKKMLDQKFKPKYRDEGMAKMKKGGSVKASKRRDVIATKGKTKGRMV